MSSARNRPGALVNPAGSDVVRPEAHAVQEQLRGGIENNGMPPAEIANLVVAAIQADKFYILPHPEWKEQIRARMEGILEERNPTTRPS